jgi:hypothetical protein
MSEWPRTEHRVGLNVIADAPTDGRSIDLDSGPPDGASTYAGSAPFLHWGFKGRCIWHRGVGNERGWGD